MGFEPTIERYLLNPPEAKERATASYANQTAPDEPSTVNGSLHHSGQVAAYQFPICAIICIFGDEGSKQKHNEHLPEALQGTRVSCAIESHQIRGAS